MFNLSLLRKWKWRILNEVNILRLGLLSLRYGDIKSQMLDDSKPIVNKSGALWWKDLNLVGILRRMIATGSQTPFLVKFVMVLLLSFGEINGLSLLLLEDFFHLFSQEQYTINSKAQIWGIEWAIHGFGMWSLRMMVRYTWMKKLIWNPSCSSCRMFSWTNIWTIIVWWRSKHKFSVKNNNQVIQAGFVFDL